jgi:hypothetical protein
MAKQTGSAGKSAREMAEDRRMRAMVPLVIMVLILWLFLKLHLITKFGLPALFVLAIGFAVARVFIEKKVDHAVKRAKDADRGALAEEKVGDELGKLPEGWHVFHDVVFSGFNIDHIAAGPGGIFAVETKSHRGKVTAQGDKLLLNGKSTEKDFLKQAWGEAFKVQEILKEHIAREVRVQPVVCFTRGFIKTPPRVKGVVVTNLGYLRRNLLRETDAIDSQTLEEVVQMLRLRVVGELPPEGQLARTTMWKDFGEQ